MAEYLYLATLVCFAALIVALHARVASLKDHLDMLERHVAHMTEQYDQIGFEAIKGDDR